MFGDEARKTGGQLGHPGRWPQGPKRRAEAPMKPSRGTGTCPGQTLAVGVWRNAARVSEVERGKSKAVTAARQRTSGRQAGEAQAAQESARTGSRERCAAAFKTDAFDRSAHPSGVSLPNCKARECPCTGGIPRCPGLPAYACGAEEGAITAPGSSFASRRVAPAWCR